MKTKSNKTITKYVMYLPMKELLTCKNTIGFKSLTVLEQCYDSLFVCKLKSTGTMLWLLFVCKL
jgi:hypothetical protein